MAGELRVYRDTGTSYLNVFTMLHLLQIHFGPVHWPNVFDPSLNRELRSS